MKKDYLILLAGFLFSSTGIIYELTSEAIVRTMIVFFADVLILFSLPFRIESKYFFSILLFLLYFISLGISSILSIPDLFYVIRITGVLFTIFSIYVLLSNDEKIKIFFIGIIMGLILNNVYYFLLIDFHHILDPLYRHIANYGPNGIAKIAALTFIIIFYYFFTIQDYKKKIFFSILLLILIVVLVATKSRTAFVVLFFSWIISLFLSKKKNIAIISIIIFIIILWQTSIFWDLIRFHDVTAEGEQNIFTLTGRIDIWKYGLDMIFHNLIFGIGPYAAEHLKMYGEHVTMDNTFLFIFLQSGLIGFLSIFTIVVVSVVNAIKNLKKTSLFSVLLLAGCLNTLTGISLLSVGMPDNFLILFLCLLFSNVSISKYKSLCKHV